MQRIPTNAHPKYGCNKKTPFTKNVTATINPIVNNKLHIFFIFDFILLLILLFCCTIDNFFLYAINYSCQRFKR